MELREMIKYYYANECNEINFEKRMHTKILRQMLRCEEINVIKKEQKMYSQRYP